MSDDHAKHVAAYRAAMEDCPASRAENDVAARHIATHLALWDRRPVTPAGRLLLATAMCLCALLPAPEARCTYCPSYACFDSAACNGCTCLQSQPWRPGQCVYIAPR